MSTLDDFDVEPSREVRAATRIDGLEYLGCPCGMPLDVDAIGTVEVAAERCAPDALARLGDVDVLFRGWECSSDGCTRVLVDTVALARDGRRESDLRTGWYPISVDLDVGETAVGFAPKPHVDELLDRGVSADE